MHNLFNSKEKNGFVLLWLFLVHTFPPVKKLKENCKLKQMLASFIGKVDCDK